MSAQNMEHLTLANIARVERANLCKAIKSPADAAQAILTCQNGIPVIKVLEAITRWGTLSAERFAEAHNLSPFATLGGTYTGDRHPLTERKREELAEALAPELGKVAA